LRAVQALAQHRRPWLEDLARVSAGQHRLHPFPSYPRAYDDSFWPPEFRRFRDSSGAPRATPAYFVVRNDELVLSAAGYTAWRREVYPALRQMVASADPTRSLQARS
jgi:hypothetical protein